MSKSSYNIEQIPWPSSNPDHFQFDNEYPEPVYNPKEHLDFSMPDYVVNLKFETFNTKGLSFQNDDDVAKLKLFLQPGLAFTSPFKLLSNEGLKVIREIIEHHKTNTPRLSKHTNRQSWCMRGLGYVSRFIRDFNRCNIIAKIMSYFAGKQLITHSMPMNYSHINIGIAGTGKKGN